MRALLLLVLGLGCGYGLALLIRPSAESSDPDPIQGSDVTAPRSPTPVRLGEGGRTPPTGPEAQKVEVPVPVVPPQPSQPETGVSSRILAYRTALQRLSEAERALLPEDSRRELPTGEEEIEKDGRWVSLLRVNRDLRDSDVERYMKWRAKRAADQLVSRYPQLDAWAKNQIVDDYLRFFDEEGRRFISERPAWEVQSLSRDERNALSAKFFEAYETRLQDVNSRAARLLTKQLPDLDWTHERFTFPVP